MKDRLVRACKPCTHVVGPEGAPGALWNMGHIEPKAKTYAVRSNGGITVYGWSFWDRSPGFGMKNTRLHVNMTESFSRSRHQPWTRPFLRPYRRVFFFSPTPVPVNKLCFPFQLKFTFLCASLL